MSARARAAGLPVNVMDDLGAFDFHFSCHRRSRRRGGRDRHRRRIAGGGAPRARTHRGDAAGADRRSRELHRPLPQIDQWPHRRDAAAPTFLGARDRRSDRRAGSCRTHAEAERRWRISPIPLLSPARSIGSGSRPGDAGRRRSRRSGFVDRQGVARAAGRRRGVLRRIGLAGNSRSRAPRCVARSGRPPRRQARHRPGRHQQAC